MGRAQVRERKQMHGKFSESDWITCKYIREKPHHSTTLETCTAHVGRERALGGSSSGSNGSSRDEADPVKDRSRPTPSKAALVLELRIIWEITSFGDAAAAPARGVAGEMDFEWEFKGQEERVGVGIFRVQHVFGK